MKWLKNLKFRIEADLYNLNERISHIQWNLKPYHVECCICGRVLRSDECDYSPEEGGWRKADKWTWICHKCLCHRDYKPYVKQVDEDEEAAWEKYYEQNEVCGAGIAQKME